MNDEGKQYVEMRQAAIDKIARETKKETFIEALFGAVAPMLAIIILQWLISG
jgi:hypothetical protein